jgi:RIO-like serine/threonine protein kinase
MLTKVRPSLDEGMQAIGDLRYEIGSGCSRTVYRIPGSPWVYKEDTSSNCDQNETEFANYNIMKYSLPIGIYLPEMHMVGNNILAAEFIDGKHPVGLDCYTGFHAKNCRNTEREEWCFWTHHAEAVDSVIGDSHSYNVKISTDGRIYILDLAD